MPASTSRLSYGDCYELFEAAQRDPQGARLKFADRASANTYRLRMNTARAIDRKDNAAIYQVDHPMHGRSEFDRYTMLLKPADGGGWYLYVQFIAPEDFKNSIEPLSTATDAEPLPWHPTDLPVASSNSGDELENAKLESASQSPTSDGSNDTSTPPRRRLLG